MQPLVGTGAALRLVAHAARSAAEAVGLVDNAARKANGIRCAPRRKQDIAVWKYALLSKIVQSARPRPILPE